MLINSYYFVLDFLFSKVLSKYIFWLAWFCYGIWNNFAIKNMFLRSCYHPKLSDTFYRSSDFRVKNCYEKNLVEMLLDFSLTSKRNSNHCAWWPSPTFYVHISQWKNFINSNFLTEKVCEQKQFGYSPNLNYQVFGGDTNTIVEFAIKKCWIICFWIYLVVKYHCLNRASWGCFQPKSA